MRWLHCLKMILKTWPRYKKINLKILKRRLRLSVRFVCQTLYYSKILKKRQYRVRGVYYLIHKKNLNTVTMSKGPTARKKKSLVYFTKFNQRTDIFYFGRKNEHYFTAFISSCSPILCKRILSVSCLVI